MISSYKSLLRQGEDLYEIIERVSVSSYMINDTFTPSLVEEHRAKYKADHVVHTPDHFLYLKAIEELTDVEYIKTETYDSSNPLSDSSTHNLQPNPDPIPSIPTEEGSGEERPIEP